MSTIITTESLLAFMAEKRAKAESAGDHPAICRALTPQKAILISKGSGESIIVPYVRFNAAIYEGATITATFGDVIVTFFRPQQPTDTDTPGLLLLGAIIEGLQDQTLRTATLFPEVLEVRWEVVAKDGPGGNKKGKKNYES